MNSINRRCLLQRALIVTFFWAGSWLALSMPLRAETLQAIVPLTPAHEIPPILNLTASGNAHLSLELTRDAAGNITAAKFTFLTTVSFPGSVTIQGLHLHEGDNRTNGNVEFDAGLSSSNSLTFANGEGFFSREATTANLATLQRLMAFPAGFYVNLHTTAHPSGAMRGQLTRFTETLARTILLSPANQVPPVTNLNAMGTATVTLNPTRNPKGEITGESLSLTVAYDFPGAVTITGLQIREGGSSANGVLRIDSNLSPINSVIAASGKGLLSQTIQIVGIANLSSLSGLIAAPANYYVSLLTTAHPNGALRGQLEGSFRTPPAIAQAMPYTLTTGTTATTINLLAVNTDLASLPLLNGQVTQSNFDLNTGRLAVQIPAELRTHPGVLALQIRSAQGLHSAPIFVNVQTNETTAAVVDAAGYSTSVAPDSIAALFGVNLATRSLGISTATLPTTLDGTTVYVNGIPAPLFFVSPGQINFQVPQSLAPGPAIVAIRNQSGAVAVARFSITHVSPGVFTRLANGKGAPAAVASTDNGQTYSLLLSNADGSPVELQVGNIAVLFGTGFHFLSGQPTATADGINLVPAYAGAQGQLIGLDQINLFIPESLRGKGETNLVFNFDGKPTNAVRIKIR